MTYISKKEKVFDLPEQEESSSTSLNQSEATLKRFPSVQDRRAWTSEEFQRYQHLYGLVNGSEPNISKSASFKYIPFDVLLTVLMAEKDAYIQELLDRQDEKSTNGEGKLYKADGFEDSDDDKDALIRKDAEMVALKNKIASLESQLEDYRETLTKAMHKLENMDTVMCENNLLREKIKCSEETIKCLEEKKIELEKESQNLKKVNATKIRNDFKYFWDAGDSEELVRLSSERDILITQVEELQKELEKAKSNAEEIQVLKKISETTSISLEEITKENECYKKKLETMKCLEKHIEELKKQAYTLTDKYKKESQRANDQLKQIQLNTKELQALRDERDRLQSRVEELLSYESQYLSLQSKLHQVEVILDENEMLNKKLIQLDRLELENEHLKMKIDQLQEAEIQAVDDRERILNLQRVVADRELEIRKMVRHIEELSEGYADRNEIYCLKNELEEKNEKLKQFEKQVREIPFLETEIEELRSKLQKCVDTFKNDDDLLKRLQEELESCRGRCHELEKMSYSPLVCSQEENTCIRGPCKTIETGAEETEEKPDTINEKRDAECQSIVKNYCEKFTEPKEFEDYNTQIINALKDENVLLHEEIEVLKVKIENVDLEEYFQKGKEMKKLLQVKEKKILELSADILSLRKELMHRNSFEELKRRNDDLSYEIKNLRDINELLEIELGLQHENAKEMKKLFDNEKRTRKSAVALAKKLEVKFMEEKLLSKARKDEANAATQKLFKHFDEESKSLKCFIGLSQELINELKSENEILKDNNKYFEIVENGSLKRFIRKLKAEIKVLKSLSKPELEEECESLKNKIENLSKTTSNLLCEVEDLKSSLKSEKSSKELLEKHLMTFENELEACIVAGTIILCKEISRKETMICKLKEELSAAKHDLENSLNEILILKEENLETFTNYEKLKIELDMRDSKLRKYLNQLVEQQLLKDEIKTYLNLIEEQKNMIKDKEIQLETQTEKILSLQETIALQKIELDKSSESEKQLQIKINELHNSLNEKEEEMTSLRKSYTETKSELEKIGLVEKSMKPTTEGKSEELTEVTNESELIEKFALEEKCALAEKYALEETLRKVEDELDELKVKFNECRKMEEEMTALKTKRDSLLEKMSGFEAEIELLKKKLSGFEDLKMELENFKSLKDEFSDSPKEKITLEEILNKLTEQKAFIENLKSENLNLKDELSKSDNLLEISKNLHKTIPQGHAISSTSEFFTPPTLLSPHSSSVTNTISDSHTMISVAAHKKEMSNLENEFKVKIQKLKDGNTKKVKKLTLFYEKDNKSIAKSFHDSINSTKSSYESGIRKLVEKHKMSIEKLQELHEEEVLELNKNYETQMDAMEKHNENLLKDLRQESAEKCKKLCETHNQEIRELENKYEEIIKELKSEIEMTKKVAASTLQEDMTSVKDGHKRAIDRLTEFYQNSIIDLQEKHSIEMKKCKKSHLKNIELMKNKYEDLLVEERKKYEEQLEEMLNRLNKGQEGGDAVAVEPKNYFRKRVTCKDARLEFIEVLQKIINEGLESLTFEELILVHCKTCFVPYEINESEERGGGELSPEVCKHKMLMGAEKEELLKRIFFLEREVVIKQLEMHEAIVNMEAAEKCRIQELKTALCNSQQANLELQKNLSNQSKVQMDLKIERYMMGKQVAMNETDVIDKVRELEREKSEKKKLEEELQREKMNVKNLMSTLDVEKERFRNQRKRDSEYVESIRQRLEEALNHEQMMESQLHNEVKFRAKLESELQSLQKRFIVLDSPQVPSSFDSQVVKDYSLDQSRKTKEKLKNRSKSKCRNPSIALNSL